MPSSQAAAAERRNDRADESFQVTNEPPKLRTTLKTPPKQATNPLQFVKVGPCSLYRTAQEQLSKVQEVKKVKQEVRDDPEDWQSNLDNWKSSRRKRQEHIIERVVEAKKLEEEEHSRQRRKGKTFSEMIEERGNRGRKLSISLNIFNDEEGSNELSDLGTGVGSNKSSISGDNHDDNQSIISDRDNEMEKNQSDSTEETTEDDCIKEDTSVTKKPNYVSECDKKVCSQKYEPTISDETKSSESDEYTYEGAIRTYVTRVSQNIPRNSAVSLEAKFEVVDFSTSPVVQEEKTIPVKVDILKRREIFEKASQQQNSEAKANSKLADVELIQSKSIKERLTHLERIKSENDKVEKKVTNSVLADTSTVRDLLSNLEKQETVQRNSSFNAEELDNVLPLKERLLTLREYEQPKSKSKETKIVKEDKQLADKKAVERENVQTNDKYSNASNDEYQSSMRISRTQFHRSLDSLDEDASSRPDSYERVQSLEELDYQKYDAFTSSNEILNDTDREDSGIQTTDVSWSVSQTDESVDDGINNTVIECVVDNKMNCTEDRARDVEHNDVPIDRQLVSKTSLYNENDSDVEVNCRTSSTESTGPSTNIAKPFTPKIDSIKEQIERPTSLNLMSTVNKEPIVPLMNSSNMLPLSLSSDEELLTSPTFPLGPPTSMDPPKEKPPPPPTDLSDDENRSNASLKRLNSTRRIKQELRSRRSDFLGIEGTNDEELERELTLNKPPDMAAILAEERRIDQLHCRSYDTDSNYDQDSSHERDSGVELGHVEDWTKQPISPDMSQHSRQSSEPFGASITSSEEDELQKKEQEIIDVLEKEEQWRYRNEHNLTSDIADKFGHKVIGLEKINVKLGQERDKYGKLTKEKQEDSTTTQQKIIKNKEEQPVEKEFNRVKTHFDNDGNHEQKTNAILNNEVKTHDDEFSQRDIFRVEQELLQLEQEELKRQRTHMALKEQKQQQQLAGKIEEQWKSRQEEENEKKNTQQFSLLAPLHYRTSMPNLQSQEGLRRRPPPPPPILPSKPLMLEQHREYSMRNNRIPSADSIPQQVNASLRHSASVTSLSSQSSQQMTRQTLQALSAAPRSRIVQGDQWVQRRKSDTPRTMHDCNYQHWLIQEAEQRRISEVNQKSPSRKSQQHVTGTSVLPPATSRSNNKPLPDSIIRTLTQRVQNRVQEKSFLKRRFDQNGNQDYQFPQQPPQQSHIQSKPYQPPVADGQDKVLSVSGKKKCSHCGEELGRGAAMIIESLRLFYHMECFKCCVCHIRLGDGLMGTDVRVRNHKLHCHNCYSSDDGVKFSCV